MSAFHIVLVAMMATCVSAQVTQSCKNEIGRLQGEIKARRCDSHTCQVLLACMRKKSTSMSAKCAAGACLAHAAAESGHCPNIAKMEGQMCSALVNKVKSMGEHCPASACNAPFEIGLDIAMVEPMLSEVWMSFSEDSAWLSATALSAKTCTFTPGPGMECAIPGVQTDCCDFLDAIMACAHKDPACASPTGCQCVTDAASNLDMPIANEAAMAKKCPVLSAAFAPESVNQYCHQAVIGAVDAWLAAGKNNVKSMFGPAVAAGLFGGSVGALATFAIMKRRQVVTSELLG